eukprot:358822-Chlamydomonas_euryale.AAC.7
MEEARDASVMEEARDLWRDWRTRRMDGRRWPWRAASATTRLRGSCCGEALTPPVRMRGGGEPGCAGAVSCHAGGACRPLPIRACRGGRRQGGTEPGCADAVSCHACGARDPSPMCACVGGRQGGGASPAVRVR